MRIEVATHCPNRTRTINSGNYAGRLVTLGSSMSHLNRTSSCPHLIKADSNGTHHTHKPYLDIIQKNNPLHPLLKPIKTQAEIVSPTISETVARYMTPLKDTSYQATIRTRNISENGKPEHFIMRVNEAVLAEEGGNIEALNSNARKAYLAAFYNSLERAGTIPRDTAYYSSILTLARMQAAHPIPARPLTPEEDEIIRITTVPSDPGRSFADKTMIREFALMRYTALNAEASSNPNQLGPEIFTGADNWFSVAQTINSMRDGVIVMPAAQPARGNEEVSFKNNVITFSETTELLSPTKLRYSISVSNTEYAVKELYGVPFSITGNARKFFKEVVASLTDGIAKNNDITAISSNPTFKALLGRFTSDDLNNIIKSLKNSIERETGDNLPTLEELYVGALIEHEKARRQMNDIHQNAAVHASAKTVFERTNPIDISSGKIIFHTPQSVVRRYAQVQASFLDQIHARLHPQNVDLKQAVNTGKAAWTVIQRFV